MSRVRVRQGWSILLDVRIVVALAPLVALGCAATEAGRGEPAAPVERVEIGASAGSGAPSEQLPQQRSFITRSAIKNGVYSVAFSLESHHGCSRSWSATAQTGEATLSVLV